LDYTQQNPIHYIKLFKRPDIFDFANTQSAT
jgi:hypothetical protein